MRKLILLVDDSKTMQNLATIYLKKDYEIMVADNGQEAIEKIKNNNVALIITDINMPIMNGTDFIRNLKENISYKNIPIIVISTEIQDLSLKEKYIAWLQKPFEKNKLLDIIKEVSK